MITEFPHFKYSWYLLTVTDSDTRNFMRQYRVYKKGTEKHSFIFFTQIFFNGLKDYMRVWISTVVIGYDSFKSGLCVVKRQTICIMSLSMRWNETAGFGLPSIKRLLWHTSTSALTIPDHCPLDLRRKGIQERCSTKCGLLSQWKRWNNVPTITDLHRTTQ